MNYTITGSSGTISKPITEALLKAGHKVTIIGREADKLKDLVSAGAIAAIGSVDDVSFLKEAFKGADAVYTMVPPNYATTKWIEYIGQVGQNYAAAINANNVKYVVNLSSIGAHLPSGAGPVSGLCHVETILNNMEGINIKHLRPAYFYHNLLSMISMIRQLNIMGSNFGGGAETIAMVHPKDIAKAAIEELLTLKFSGHSIRYIAGDGKTGAEIAKIIGAELGKPDLQWIEFTDEQALQGMLQAGLPQEQASGYIELGQSLRNGTLAEDFNKQVPEKSGTSFEVFAKEFAAIYNQ